MDMAYKLEGIVRNVGKHAGGVVIAPSRLTDFVPLYLDDASAGVVSQFDKDDVERAGLVKFDFLGLKTLTIIDWTVAAINEVRADGAPELDITQLPLDDGRVFDLLKRAETTAVFQFESRGMRDLLKQAKPDRFEDIIALGALFRPGPMELIPDFIKRKHGQERFEYPDPRVVPILSPTAQASRPELPPTPSSRASSPGLPICGTGGRVHAVPFQCRISGTWTGLLTDTLVSPTAHTSFADTALMLRSWPSWPSRLLGSVSAAQAVPFQCTMTGAGTEFTKVDPAA